jgi:hypothetical protein
VSDREGRARGSCRSWGERRAPGRCRRMQAETWVALDLHLAEPSLRCLSGSRIEAFIRREVLPYDRDARLAGRTRATARLQTERPRAGDARRSGRRHEGDGYDPAGAREPRALAGGDLEAQHRRLAGAEDHRLADPPAAAEAGDGRPRFGDDGAAAGAGDRGAKLAPAGVCNRQRRRRERRERAVHGTCGCPAAPALAHMTWPVRVVHVTRAVPALVTAPAGVPPRARPERTSTPSNRRWPGRRTVACTADSGP